MKTHQLNNGNGPSATLHSGCSATTPDFSTLLEWVRLATATVRKNVPCIEKHRQNLRSQGETENRLTEFEHWHDSLNFTEKEKIALDLCENLSTLEPENLSNLKIQEARRHFNTDDITDLILTSIAVNEWIDLHGQSPIRVLVVEDNPWDQELLLRELSKTQLANNVIIMPNALQALQLIEHYKGCLSSQLIAMFLDLNLPDISGLELLRRIRAIPTLKELPTIVMTSSNNPRDIEECKRLNVMSYIQKPITFSSFSKEVANIFHSGQERNGSRAEILAASD